MKTVVAVLCILQLTAGYTSCPKYHRNFDPDVYLDQNIENYAVYSVPRQDVTFRLWTRDQKVNFAPIYYGHLRDEETIRPQKPFKIIVHGWTDCADADWYQYLKNEFLKKDDYNIILVDWRDPAGALYPLSASYSKDVGKYVGELIVDLNSTLGVPFENVHLIGHSLGAHISGFAGKHVQKAERKTIGRVTGMDPAGPLFLLATAAKRLNHGDAIFVDVIHTDGGKLGYMNNLGHVDFYPNGGSAPQAGCLLFGDIIDAASCSHTRSFWIFGESINSEGFIANECGSFARYKHGDCQNTVKALMGDNCDTTTRGSFYLTTNAEKPFAKYGQI